MKFKNRFPYTGIIKPFINRIIVQNGKVILSSINDFGNFLKVPQDFLKVPH